MIYRENIMAKRVQYATSAFEIGNERISIFPDEYRKLVMNLNYNPAHLMFILERSNQTIIEFDKYTLPEENSNNQ